MRLFYALWPGPDTRARIAEAAGVLSLGNAARLVPLENYHLTLAFVGEVSPARLAVLQQIGRDLRMAGCTIRFDAYEYWPESQVVVARAREAPVELTELSRQLHSFDGAHRLAPAGHDPPLHVHRAAAIAFVRGQAQMIYKHRECGQREMIRQDHADTQRRARAVWRRIWFLRTRRLGH